MKYNGMIYRPPVEADTFLIPVTEGCTHNSCSFCNMYQGVPSGCWHFPRSRSTCGRSSAATAGTAADPL